MNKKLFSFVFILLMLFTINGFPYTATLTWDNPTSNFDVVEGYNIYLSTETGVYSAPYAVVNNKNVTTFSFNVDSMPDGKIYCVMTSFNNENESAKSSEVYAYKGVVELDSPTPQTFQITENALNWTNEGTVFNGSTVVPVGDVLLSSDTFKLETTLTVDPGSYSQGRIISKTTDDDVQSHVFMLSLYNQKLRFRLKIDGFTHTLISTVDFPTTEMTVECNYDGSAMKIIQNGVVVGELPVTGNVTDIPSVNTSIGGNPDGSYVFTGDITSVIVY